MSTGMEQALPFWFSDVHDDRYCTDSGSVLVFEAWGHSVDVTGHGQGWRATIDGERFEIPDLESLGRWLERMSSRLVGRLSGGRIKGDGDEPINDRTAVPVLSTLEPGLAADLLWWMSGTDSYPIINLIPFTEEFGRAPATENSLSDKDRVWRWVSTWEWEDPTASWLYGSVWNYRIGSRVMQTDPDFGRSEAFLWQGDGDAARGSELIDPDRVVTLSRPGQRDTSWGYPPSPDCEDLSTEDLTTRFFTNGFPQDPEFPKAPRGPEDATDITLYFDERNEDVWYAILIAVEGPPPSDPADDPSRTLFAYRQTPEGWSPYAEYADEDAAFDEITKDASDGLL